MSAEPLTAARAGTETGAASPDPGEELRQRAERVDRALTRVESMEPGPRSHALALKGAIEAFHKAGLTTIVRTLKADPRGREILFELVDDPEVYALFTLHGLVRSDLRAKVVKILDDFARPYLQSHGGDVELVDVRERVVTVRLTGACNGCSMSSVTLRNSVEETLRTHAPEIERVETAPAEPLAEPGFVPLSALGKGGSGRGWIEGPPLDSIEEGRAYRLEVPGDAETTVLLLRFDGQVRAFRNACAHQGLPLDGGLVDRAEGTISCPWHGFCYDGRTGECLTAPQAQLEPFPLRVDDGRIFVRPQ